jgi:putative sigma-54 modulation protein
MQVSVTGHHVEVTPALRAYVEDKIGRLERHFDHMTNIHVILSVEKERKKAEATVSVTRGSLFADTVHADMYAAIDTLVDKLDRQLKKHKEKLTDHRRGEAAARGDESP